jgi:hypothetical protein
VRAVGAAFCRRPGAEEKAMQASVYLARLIGPPFVVIGLGMLANGEVYHAMGEEFLRSHALIYLSGILALVAGLAIVNAHNVWALDWRVIITVFGWLAVIGGVLRIAVPQLVQAVGTAMFSGTLVTVIAAIVVLALGGVLSFKGYMQ